VIRNVAIGASALATFGLAVATAVTWPRDGDGPAAVAHVVETDRGRALFAAKGSAGCHTGPGTPSQGIGISLVDVPSRVPGMSRADYIRQSILRPAAVVAPSAGEIGPFPMPALALDPGEVDALVEYLIARDEADA
jgi:cytochrome c551/c552